MRRNSTPHIERVYVKVNSDFDSTGYMKTGWISWKGQWYYCGPDGKMWKNTYVENQYWADENGVCAR